MYTRNAILTLLLPFLILACSGDSGQTDPNVAPGINLTVILADTGEVHVLQDDLMRVRSVNRIDFVSDHAFIARSFEAPLSYFENHNMVRTFGAIGKGPCEYTLAQAFDTSGDSLFILSPEQSKIITFRISTGECLGELNTGSLVDYSYLARESGAFIIGRFSYYAGTPDSTVLLHRMEDDGTRTPLPLTLGMLNPVPVTFQMPALVHDFVRQEDRLYAYFRYTNYLISIDTGHLDMASMSPEVETLPLELDLGREEFEEAGSDFREALDIMGNSLEMITRMQASDQWLAASTIRGNGNTENSQWLQFYSLEGKPMGRVYTEETPVGGHNGRLVYVLPSEDPASEYAYRLYYRDVILQ